VNPIGGKAGDKTPGKLQKFDLGETQVHRIRDAASAQSERNPHDGKREV
jgi:hypothetical protein